MPSRDVADILTQLQNMMSHGIFDAEVVAANFRTNGWKFVMDPEKDFDDLTGGQYLIRTPEGREGVITWYTAPKVEELVANAGFFTEGKAPRALLLAWIFAGEMSQIIFGRNPSEDPSLYPGTVFRTAYEWMESSQTTESRGVDA